MFIAWCHICARTWLFILSHVYSYIFLVTNIAHSKLAKLYPDDSFRNGDEGVDGNGHNCIGILMGSTPTYWVVDLGGVFANDRVVARLDYEGCEYTRCASHHHVDLVSYLAIGNYSLIQWSAYGLGMRTSYSHFHPNKQWYTYGLYIIIFDYSAITYSRIQFIYTSILFREWRNKHVSYIFLCK